MPPCTWIFLSLSLSLTHTLKHTHTHTQTQTHTNTHTNTHTFPRLSRSRSPFLAAGNRFDESLNHVGGTSFYLLLSNFHFNHQNPHIHGKMYTHTYMAHFKAQSCASWALHLERRKERESAWERERERGVSPWIVDMYPIDMSRKILIGILWVS